MKKQFLVATLLLSSSLFGRSQKAAFGYVEGHQIVIADATGHTITAFRAPHAIEDFSVDSSAQHLALATREGEYGGELLWCTIAQQRCTILASSTNYLKKDPAMKEVSADPSLSPNADTIAFAIHSQYRNAARAKEEDLVEASGPIALINTDGNGARILKSTLDLQAGGPFFANSPQWSPDGKRILFSFEVGGGVIDAAGENFIDLSTAMEGSMKDSWVHPLTWLGNDFILFARAPSSKQSDVADSEVFRLSLSNLRVEAVDHIGAVPAIDLRGALSLEVSNDLVAVQTWESARVYGRATGELVWKKRSNVPGNAVALHLIFPIGRASHP